MKTIEVEASPQKKDLPALTIIIHYILNPDNNGNHLKAMSDYMAHQAWQAAPNETGRFGMPARFLRESAWVIGRYISHKWPDSLPEIYAPRTLEVLLGIQHAMRRAGMHAESTWHYALSAFSRDMEQFVIGLDTPSALA